MKPDTTIHVDFEKDVLPVLPKWAREDKPVVEMCKRDLAFRCNVFDAPRWMRASLKREARRLMK